MESTLERIKRYIDHKKISVSSFEKSMGFSNGSFASQLKKGKSIGVDKLEKIVNEYPDLNISWLLTGVGDMLNNRPLKSYVDNNAPFHLERRMMNKVEEELAKETSERSKVYKDINTILNFQDIITKLDQNYFEKIDRMFYEILGNYKGNKFDFEKYRSDIYNEIDKVMPLAPHLANLAKAIKEFYSDVQAVDSKQVIKW